MSKLSFQETLERCYTLDIIMLVLAVAAAIILG